MDTEIQTKDYAQMFEELHKHIDTMQPKDYTSTIEQIVKNMGVLQIQYLIKMFEEIHRHIDLVQRDLMITSDFIKKHKIELKTDFPIAIQSPDYLFPNGTKNDNTRCPRFIRKCESLFPVDRELKFLDLGCSGGGVVLDACLKGHVGIGLEGSDYSFLNQRAEWRLLKDNLFTCDVTKDFELYDNETKDIARFDIISAWEVLEHLPEFTLEMFFDNVKKHLADDGYFVASIAMFDDINPENGVNWHCTVKSPEWWLEKIDKFGFENHPDLFALNDFARGSQNPPLPWKEGPTFEQINQAPQMRIVLTKKS